MLCDHSIMKHHLYSIYLGGAKTLLKNLKFCKDCGFIIPKYLEKTHRIKNDK